MDAEQQRLITNAIAQKLGARTLICPISGPDATWAIQRQSTTLPALDQPGDAPSMRGPAYPLAIVVCEDCGYSFLVNLIKLGLADELGIVVAPDE